MTTRDEMPEPHTDGKWCRDLRCSKCYAAETWQKAEITTLRARCEELEKEVREWLCEDCNTVYPGPPAKGFQCVVCPKCGGTTLPRTLTERRKAEQRAESAEAKLAECEKDAERLRFQYSQFCKTVAATGINGGISSYEQWVASIDAARGKV